MADTTTPASSIPDPPINPESEAFWRAANFGRLMIGYCGQCALHHYYPRSTCPLCHAPGAALRAASGAGVIHTYSATLRGTPEPYVIAQVRLAEGPIVLSNIVYCDWENLRIGQPVALVFRASRSGQAVPMFAPKENAKP